MNLSNVDEGLEKSNKVTLCVTERGERFLQLATDECEHRRLEARVVRRHERRSLHRVQPVVPVAAAGLRRAVAALQ